MTQEHIREICWDIGTKFPIPFTSEYLTFSMIYPKRGYLQWHVKESSVHALQAKCGDAFHGSRLVIRIYDVTDVVFNGFNAHTFFDLDVHGIVGNYYMTVERTERNLLAELGFRFRDNSFHALARSATIFFDRDRPSGKFDTSGLFVGNGFQPIFDVENVFDAPIYERVSRELSDVERAEPLSVAVVFLGEAIAGEHSKPLERLIAQLNEGSQKFGGRIAMLTAAESSQADGNALFASVERAAAAAYKSLELAHTTTPFHIVHCHDWYSAPVGIQAIKTLNLPFVLSLHSTEYERSQGGAMNEISSAICEREKAAVQAADLIIVPHSSTRQQVISLYGATEDNVTIISEAFEHEQSTFQSIQDIKRSLGLNGDWPVALFAGEISHASGADLMMDALIQVSKRHGEAQFVFVGNGPLKGELESRAWHGGVAHRCRFLGDVAREYFESVLLAADFVVIPGRTWQDSGLAQKAIEFGKPVLTTHQSHISCVTHGQNGLVTYDNPGSIIWGLNEMLANPLQGNMLRLAARRSANQTQSPESSAMEQYLLYEHLLKRIQGGTHV